MKKPANVGPAVTPGDAPARGDIDAILNATHGDAFSVLGVQQKGKVHIARCFIPGAETVEAFDLDGNPVGKLNIVDAAGFFSGVVAIDSFVPLRYRATRGDAEWTVTDPYSFWPVLGPMDDYFVREGSHLRLFDKLGAHPMTHQGVDGFHFAVWAPNARRVSVVGSFNDWDGRRHMMRFRRDSGVWEIFAPDVEPGQPYKFEIIGADGALEPLKADPFARRSELRPQTASLTAAELEQEWDDEEHRKHWGSIDKRRQPISIYEVHAGSWQRRDDGSFLSWDELADRLIPYCTDMGLYAYRISARLGISL